MRPTLEGRGFPTGVTGGRGDPGASHFWGCAVHRRAFTCTDPPCPPNPRSRSSEMSPEVAACPLGTESYPSPAPLRTAVLEPFFHPRLPSSNFPNPAFPQQFLGRRLPSEAARAHSADWEQGKC